MLQAHGGSGLVPVANGTLANHTSGEQKCVAVVQLPVGYWIDNSGYPVLNGIYARQKSVELSYEHMRTRSILEWVPQGWLLRLADGTECFLQMSTTQMMVVRHCELVVGEQALSQSVKSDSTSKVQCRTDRVQYMYGHNQ